MNVTRYLHDKGIVRRKQNGRKQWSYHNAKNNTRVSKKTLEHIQTLAIPPQWNNVWIASSPHTHIQATGVDSAGRKQYIYSARWVKAKNYQKYRRAQKLIEEIPKFKRILRRCLHNREHTKDKVIAAMFDIMLKTGIRAGNEVYAEANNTYGLASMKIKHLIGRSFIFLGKGGIEQTISLAKVCQPTMTVLRYLQKNKKKEASLFPYSASDMNLFLKRYMSGYTCKDFRTVRANEEFIRSFLRRSRSCAPDIKLAEIKRDIILKAIDDSASVLGNTRTVCRSSYLNPRLLDYCLHHFKKAQQNTKKELWMI